MTANPVITIRNAYKNFGKITALKDISLDIYPGEKIVLLGPSGSGKSTLLRSINKLEPIDSGTIIVNGVDINHPDSDINLLRQDLGMVFQSFNLFPHKTVLQNLTLAPMNLHKQKQKDAEERAMEMLKKVGISEKAKVYPSSLSGGQQQRVAIARALVMNPKIMLFDEPTSALDPEMIGEVLDVMVTLAKEGMTMVCVSHEMGFAREVADSLIFMDNGEILEENNSDDFSPNPSTPVCKSFYNKFYKHKSLLN